MKGAGFGDKTLSVSCFKIPVNYSLPSACHRSPSLCHRLPSPYHKSPSLCHRSPSPNHSPPSIYHSRLSANNKSPSANRRGSSLYDRLLSLCSPLNVIKRILILKNDLSPFQNYQVNEFCHCLGLVVNFFSTLFLYWRYFIMNSCNSFKPLAVFISLWNMT